MSSGDTPRWEASSTLGLALLSRRSKSFCMERRFAAVLGAGSSLAGGVLETLQHLTWLIGRDTGFT
jgi:hypothetical protein